MGPSTLVALGASFLVATPLWVSGEEDSSEEEPSVETLLQLQEAEDPRFASGLVSRLRVEGLLARGRDLADIVAKAPGVYVRRQSSVGQASYASIRGGNPRQISLSFSGLRLRAPFGVGFDLASVPFGVDLVDVYRGSAGLVRGSGALTGAIDFRSSLHRSPGSFQGLDLSLGAFSTYGAQVDLGVRSKRGGIRVRGGVRQSAGDFPFTDDQGSVYQRVNNASTRAGIHVVAQHESGSGVSTLHLARDGSRRGVPGPSEFQSSFAQTKLREDRDVFVLEHRRRDLLRHAGLVVDGHLLIGSQASSSHYENPSPLFGGEPVDEKAQFRSMTATGGLSVFSHFDGQLSLGAEVHRDRYLGGRNLRAARLTIAGFASSEWWFFRERLSLIGGLRSESIDGDRQRTVLLPSTGAIYRVADWLALKGNLGKTFRVPDFDELYLDLETLRGDTDLVAEESITTDAGFRVSVEPFVVESVFFHRWLDHQILFLPRTAYLTQAQNLSDTTAHGTESAVRAGFGRAFGLEATHTWTVARLTGESASVPHQPEHRVTMGLKTRPGLLLWSVLPDWTLDVDASVRSAVNLDLFGTHSNPSATLLDLTTEYRPWTWLTAGLSVHNVMDGRGIVDALQRPLPGRATYLYLQVANR
jgi:vitamin B12 transporter